MKTLQPEHRMLVAGIGAAKSVARTQLMAEPLHPRNIPMKRTLATNEDPRQVEINS
ncbi:hypothetical protein AS9A_1348 [Hoyosella subflava DQS3-9A1]|uniref:Uncharacterized protein n=1 Tax=Hoyosella subflava (strain DSM 45089 / JCM 17490 / NBRC 109087 / DQS3-9A1) TaxID=443218 RepID=F6EG75_HOYSD|nr:hypothetical protein AS9A_1348 [Hoyosella subflava DQS3-9A1]